MSAGRATPPSTLSTSSESQVACVLAANTTSSCSLALLSASSLSLTPFSIVSLRPFISRFRALSSRFRTSSRRRPSLRSSCKAWTSATYRCWSSIISASWLIFNHVTRAAYSVLSISTSSSLRYSACAFSHSWLDGLSFSRDWLIFTMNRGEDASEWLGVSNKVAVVAGVVGDAGDAGEL